MAPLAPPEAPPEAPLSELPLRPRPCVPWRYSSREMEPSRFLSSASKLGRLAPAPALAPPLTEPDPVTGPAPTEPDPMAPEDEDAPGALVPGVPAPVPDPLCANAPSGRVTAAASATAVM